MGLGFVRRLLGISLGVEKVSAQAPDHRSLERFAIHENGVAHLTLDSGDSGAILEASYGAVGVAMKAPRLDAEIGRLGGQLTVLGRSVRVALKPVRSTQVHGEAFTAFMLLHDSPESLVFLRELLEPLRRGRSLFPADRTIVADRYRGEDWECWRGDGPTDLLLRRAVNHKGLAEAVLSYRFGELHAELVYFCDGDCQDAPERLAVGFTGAGAGSPRGTELSHSEMLRFAICLTAGLEQDLRYRLQPFFKACSRQLLQAHASASPAA